VSAPVGDVDERDIAAAVSLGWGRACGLLHAVATSRVRADDRVGQIMRSMINARERYIGSPYAPAVP
jgi:hypothetical protein